MSEPSPAVSTTVLLRAWRSGDSVAHERLMEAVYGELSSLARGALRRERADHTLQTRALVHEAYLKLVNADVDWQDRGHFFALAARAMRRVLTDHAKARGRVKRGENPIRVDLSGLHPSTSSTPIDLLDLEAAVEKLSARDPRHAQMVELHFYAGLDYDETAKALGVSPRTVSRDLRVARAFLARELGLPAT